jgi:hypothetical protein
MKSFFYEFFMCFLCAFLVFFVITAAGCLFGGLFGLLASMLDTKNGGIEQLWFNYVMQGVGFGGIFCSLFGLVIGFAVFCAVAEHIESENKNDI